MSLPFIGFDLQSVAREARFDVLSSFWRDSLDFEPIEHPERILATARMWVLGDCILEHSTNSPLRFRRKTATPHDHMALVTYVRTGRLRNILADSLQDQNTDEILIGDYHDISGRVFEAASELVIFYAPPERLGFRGALPRRSIPISSPLGSVLRATLVSSVEKVPLCTPTEGVALADALTSVLEIALKAPGETGSVSLAEQKRNAVLRHIEDDLGNPDLDAQQLCERFAMSRSSLYRLFSEHGGLRRYVTLRRMQLIRSKLELLPPEPGVVRRIAEDFGFDDVSQFSRVFKRHLGFAPSDVVGSRRGCSEEAY